MNPSVREKFNIIQHRYQSLANRERLLILSALGALVYIVWNLFVFAPQSSERAKLRAEVESLQQSLQRAETELAVLSGLSQRDPFANLERELRELNGEVAAMDDQLQSLAVGLIKPESLPLVLREILVAQEKVQLVRMHTLMPQEVTVAGEALPAAGPIDKAGSAQASTGSSDKSLMLYRHGVHMVMRAPFSATLEYLRRLEGSQWQFYWGSLAYRVVDYPMAEVSLNVYTLSASKEASGG